MAVEAEEVAAVVVEEVVGRVAVEDLVVVDQVGKSLETETTARAICLTDMVSV